MNVKCEERQLDWASEADGIYRFTYLRNGETYLWRCRAEYRRECLLAISLDAGNPALSLDYFDAAIITARVRDVVPASEPVAEADDLFSDCDGAGSVEMLGAMLIVLGLFWLAVGLLVVVVAGL